MPPRRYPLAPIGAIVFYLVAVYGVSGLAFLLEKFDRTKGLLENRWWSHAAIELLVLPLAYLFYPNIFSKRFWRFPPKAGAWLIGLTALKLLIFLVPSPYPPAPKAVVFAMVFIGPPIEEIMRTILITPFLERWGSITAIVIGSLVVIATHPNPGWVIGTTILLTVMLVKTDRSVLATAITHSIMNACVVIHAGVWRS